MRIPKIKQKHKFRDMKGVWTWDQLTSHIGSWTMRNSWKIGPFFGAAVGAWMGIKGDLPGWKSAIAPVVSTAGMFSVGATIKLGVNIFYASQVAAAQGNLMNLMEDYRDQNKGPKLDRLWERVFQYEPFEEYLENDHKAIGLERVVATTNPQARKEEFMKLANHVLGLPYSQSKQMEMTGISWGILENWLNAGPLEIGDRKIYDDYCGRASIQTIKKQVKFTKLEKNTEFWKLSTQALWHSFISKSLAVNVGGSVKALNNKYDTDLFSAQTILWPGEEDADWIRQINGAKENVLKSRQYIIERIFGKDFSVAKRKLVRMHNPVFELLTFLRAKFDHEYVQGDLGYTPRTDLIYREYEENEIIPYDLAQIRAKLDTDILYSFLDLYNPEILYGERNVQAKRAVGIAFHTNRDGLKDDIYMGETSESASKNAREKIDYVLKRKGTYSRRLVDLRMLHELSSIAIDEYTGMIKSLGYNMREGKKGENT